MLIVFGAYGLKLLESVFGCQGCNENTCYYGTSGYAKKPITIFNFEITQVNFTSSWIYLVIGFIVFSILTVYPIEFWRKLPFKLSMILSVYLF